MTEHAALERAILDSANYSIISTDLDGVIRTFNRTSERWLGYRAEEVVGVVTPAIIHERQEVTRRAAELTLELGEFVEPGFEAFVAKCRRGEPDENDWTYVRKDGTRFPVRLSVTGIRDLNGRLTGFLGVGTDVTVQRQMEVDLRESQERFQAAFTHAAIGMALVAPSGVFLRVNPSLCGFLGYSADELLARTFQELTHPDDLEADVAQVNWMLSDEIRTYQMEKRYLRKDGRVVWAQLCVSLVRDGAGAPLYFISEIKDITIRKATEAAIAERIRLASFSATIGTALTRGGTLRDTLQNCAAAMVEYLGAAFARIWTLNESEQVLELQASAGIYTHTDGPHGRVPVGKFKIGLIAAEKKPHLTNAVIGDPRVGNQDWASQEGMVAFAGHPLIVADRVVGVMGLFSRTALSPATLEALGAVADGIAIGIERARAEERLVMAKAAAESANRTKSEFLANMSHELRTPLNSVIGFTGILIRNKAGNLREQDLTYLQRIHQNGLNLLGLINQILDLSKVEAGRMELDLVPVNLGDLVREMATHLEPQIRDKDVQLAVEVPPGLRSFSADKEKIRQVLVNLAANAVKFTEHGFVTLRVLTATDGVTPAAVEVWDTGIGIPSDKLGTIFEAFRQADGSTARKYGGTGLGLTITRSLCQLMGYTIEAESEPGRGSVFRVRFGSPSLVAATGPPVIPAVTEATAVTAVAAIAPVGRAPSENKLVLVIDDDPDSRMLITRYAEDEGFRVLAASSGEQGLELARSIRPQIILLDLMMPGVDGWQVLRLLKADEALRDIPVVVISIVASENRCSLVGAVDLLDKPAPRDAIVGVLNRNLRAYRSRVLLVEDDLGTRELVTASLTASGYEVQVAANGREALDRLEHGPVDAILLDLRMPVMDGWQFLSTLREGHHWDELPVIVMTAGDLSLDETQQLGRQALSVLRKDGDFTNELKHILNWTKVDPGVKP